MERNKEKASRELRAIFADEETLAVREREREREEKNLSSSQLYQGSNAGDKLFWTEKREKSITFPNVRVPLTWARGTDDGQQVDVDDA